MHFLWIFCIFLCDFFFLPEIICWFWVVYLSSIFQPDTENKSESVQKAWICSIDKCMKQQRELKIFITVSIKSNLCISANVLKGVLICTHASVPIHASSEWGKHPINKRGLSQSHLLAASLLLEGIFLLGSPTETSLVDWKGSNILIELRCWAAEVFARNAAQLIV